MPGEIYAIFSAVAYGLAGVSIVKGKKHAQGDNGVFLAVVATAILSCIVWMGWGTVSLGDLGAPDNIRAVLIFAVAGLFSTVLGRITMYRATEQIGAISAGLLRRLTPVFALPFAFVVVGEIAAGTELFGGGLILAGVMWYLLRPGTSFELTRSTGLMLGIGSACFYAMSYALRASGLELLPDVAFGTLVGALIGCAWFPGAALMRRNKSEALRRLVVDRGKWSLITALSLSVGQILQFAALHSATVTTVAVVGSLDVLFSAAIIMFLPNSETVPVRRLLVAVALAAVGTGFIFAD